MGVIIGAAVGGVVVLLVLVLLAVYVQTARCPRQNCGCEREQVNASWISSASRGGVRDVQVARYPCPEFRAAGAQTFLCHFVFLSPNFAKFVRELYLQTDCTLEIERRNSRAQKSIAGYMYSCWEQNRGSAAGYMYFGCRIGGAQPVTFTLGAESGSASETRNFRQPFEVLRKL